MIHFYPPISPPGYQSVYSETKTKKVAFTPTATLSLAFPPTTPPASPAAYQIMSFPMLSPPPPSTHSTQVTCPKESWQNYREANKDTNGRSRQLALASAFITSHFHDTLKPLMEPPLHACDGLHGAVTPAFGVSRLPRLRQSEVSNEYTCVVCSRDDTGRNRAREEDEYWVNVLSRV